MDIRLSWDLFILVFFGIVIAYSFIIGRNATIKMIISAYMAILTADSIGHLIEVYLVPAAPALQGIQGEQVLILTKIFIFVLTIVLLVIKGGFIVDMIGESSVVARLMSTLTFGFLSGGLLVTTVLVYLSSGSFIFGGIETSFQTDLYLESEFVRMLLDQAGVWFSLPALALVVASFLEPRE